MPRTTSQDFIDRSTQEPDVIYVHNDSGIAFVTPDGIGRYWFDSEEEAIEEYGDDMPTEGVDHICDYDECLLGDDEDRTYCPGGMA